MKRMQLLKSYVFLISVFLLHSGFSQENKRNTRWMPSLGFHYYAIDQLTFPSICYSLRYPFKRWHSSSLSAALSPAVGGSRNILFDIPFYLELSMGHASMPGRSNKKTGYFVGAGINYNQVILGMIAFKTFNRLVGPDFQAGIRKSFGGNSITFRASYAVTVLAGQRDVFGFGIAYNLFDTESLEMAVR